MKSIFFSLFITLVFLFMGCTTMKTIEYSRFDSLEIIESEDGIFMLKLRIPFIVSSSSYGAIKSKISTTEKDNILNIYITCGWTQNNCKMELKEDYVILPIIYKKKTSIREKEINFYYRDDTRVVLLKTIKR